MTTIRIERAKEGDAPPLRWATDPLQEALTFHVASVEVLRFEAGGNIYVKGRLVENDLEVVDGMRAFLRASGQLK